MYQQIPLKIHLQTMVMHIRFGLMSLSLVFCDRVVMCDHELSCMTLVLSTLKKISYHSLFFDFIFFIVMNTTEF